MSLASVTSAGRQEKKIMVVEVLIMAMVRKSLYINDVDRACIESIRREHGCVSDSQAMRLALRALGSNKSKIALPEISKFGRRKE